MSAQSLCSSQSSAYCFQLNIEKLELALCQSVIRKLLLTVVPLAPAMFSCSEIHSLMQLTDLSLGSNQLDGSLPEAWGNLTKVSPVFDDLVLLVV